MSAKLVLASSSPRRRELLSLLINDFQVQSADINEEPLERESPEDLVQRLAREKALKIAEENPEAIILAADTIVVVDQEILGKPKNKADARKMLQKLSGNRHFVFSAYQIFSKQHQLDINNLTASEIEFNTLSDQEVEDYVNTGEPMDKAGAYALQGIAAKFIKEVRGSHTSVIGLNLSAVYEDLKQAGIL